MDTSPNRTGLPDKLKAGIELLSGMSMDNVKVHTNSDQPAQLNALAYAQGSDIHIAQGQEKHLPHEAWHVVQQAQSRVKPTMQMKADVAINDDAGLELEADAMGGELLNANNRDLSIRSSGSTLMAAAILDEAQADRQPALPMRFQFPEYDQFFHDLLCDEGESLDKYAELFDLREPHTLKRIELTAAKYKAAWEELEKKFGRICQLQYANVCDLHDPSAIDHVIPLGTNKLNKQRGGVPVAKGKKIGAESFGSDHVSNLVLACKKCNDSKKHRFLDRDSMRRILKTKGF